MSDIENISTNLQPVFQKYHVRKALLFGSHAKNTATPRSDIDICVDSDLHGLKFVGLMEEIRRNLHDTNVDIIDTSHIETNSPVAKEIQETGIVIYGR